MVTERSKYTTNDRCSAYRMCCLSDRVYFGQSLIDLAETQSPAFWGWNMQYEIKTPDGHLTGLHYQEQPKGAISKYIVGVRMT